MGNNGIVPMAPIALEGITTYTNEVRMDNEANSILLILAVAQREMKHM